MDLDDQDELDEEIWTSTARVQLVSSLSPNWTPILAFFASSHCVPDAYVF
jgi:hypothetical protein